jgi:dihydroxyacid dehydratase/phosphogluconate dehydratase
LTRPFRSGGDLIAIDIPGTILELQVTADELDRRRAA